MTAHHCGRVGLIGRPNAGKSTLLNRALGEKLAIVSDKPQTTRHRIIGLLSEDRGQMILVDTPGVHKPQYGMNRRMVKQAVQALEEVDVVCLIVDAKLRFGGGDRFMLSLIERVSTPKLLVLNKVDEFRKTRLLPLIEQYAEHSSFDEIVPISALTGEGVENLLELLWARLPEGPAIFDRTLLTVHPVRFLAAERIREKVLRHTRDELPFSTAVVIDDWEEGADLVRITASILVEKESQKGIVIGAGGQMVKLIGTEARYDLIDLVERRVMLDLRVRCELRWRDQKHILEALDTEPWRGSAGPDSDP